MDGGYSVEASLLVMQLGHWCQFLVGLALDCQHLHSLVVILGRTTD